MLGKIIGGILPSVISWGAKKLSNLGIGKSLETAISPNIMRVLKRTTNQMMSGYLKKQAKTKQVKKPKKGRKSVSFA